MQLRNAVRVATVRAVVVSALVLLAVGVARAKEIDRLGKALPPHTLVYVAFRNPQATEGYRASAVNKVSQDPEMKEFIANVKGEYVRLLNAHRTEIPFPPELLEEALQNEISIAYTGMAVDAQGNMLPAVIVSAVFQREPAAAREALLKTVAGIAGPDAAQARDAFTEGGVKVESLQLPGAPPIYFAFLGKRLVATPAEQSMRTLLSAADQGPAVAGQPPRSLAETPRYRNVMAKVGGDDAMLAVYVNSESLLNMFADAMPPDMRVIMDLYGLASIRAIGIGSRFVDGGVRDAFYFDAPGPRTGLLVPPPEPVDLSLLRCVPQDAVMASLTRLDAQKVYRLITGVMAKFEPRKHDEFMQELGKFEQRAGFRLDEDLLAALGSQVLFYHAPRETVIMVEVKNKPKFEDCLAKLVRLAPNDLQLNELSYKGATIRHLDFTDVTVPASPSFTYYKQFAVIGLYPQTLKSFLARVAVAGPSILDNKDFARVAGRYLNKSDGISYWDIREGLVDFYDLMVIAAPMVNGTKEIQLRPELMPSPTLLEPCVFGLGSGVLNDKDGVLTEVFSPLGTAGALFGAVGSLRKIGGGMTTAPIMAGMLLPALARAREEARRSVCRNNLMQIGKASITYQLNNNDKLPEKLADLVPKYIDNKQVFVCPSRGLNPGEDPVASSYVYVGRIDSTVGPNVIIAYEKGDNHDRGRNALYMDGHVRWLFEPMVRRELQQSLAQVKARRWDQYAAEQQKAIEAFYADRVAAPEKAAP